MDTRIAAWRGASGGVLEVYREGTQIVALEYSAPDAEPDYLDPRALPLWLLVELGGDAALALIRLLHQHGVGAGVACEADVEQGAARGRQIDRTMDYGFR